MTYNDNLYGFSYREIMVNDVGYRSLIFSIVKKCDNEGSYEWSTIKYTQRKISKKSVFCVNICIFTH
jgi:hypothetical protein